MNKLKSENLNEWFGGWESHTQSQAIIMKNRQKYILMINKYSDRHADRVLQKLLWCHFQCVADHSLTGGPYWPSANSLSSHIVTVPWIHTSHHEKHKANKEQRTESTLNHSEWWPQTVCHWQKAADTLNMIRCVTPDTQIWISHGASRSKEICHTSFSLQLHHNQQPADESHVQPRTLKQ